MVTADTGFANETNMAYVYEQRINAYIPDNQFRSRDPRFDKQKTKYGKRHQEKRKRSTPPNISASEFTFDPVKQTCICPQGKYLTRIFHDQPNRDGF